MNSKEMAELKDKIADYTQYAMILVALSAFLYIGIFIPSEQLIDKLNLLIGAICLLLALSCFFIMKVLRYKKRLQQYMD